MEKINLAGERLSWRLYRWLLHHAGGKAAGEHLPARPPRNFHPVASRDSQSDQGPDGIHPSSMVRKHLKRVAFTNLQGMGQPLTQIEDIVPIVSFWQPG